MTIVALGVMVGGLAAGGTIVGVTIAVSEIVGTLVAETPRVLLGAASVGAATIVGLTRIFTSSL